jgi:transposase
VAKAYSEDLRERIGAAWQEGKSTRAQLAARFGVSVSCVRDLIRRLKETGSVAAKAHGGGAPRKADQRQEELLARLVAAQPDDTLEEYRAALAATPGGVGVSGVTISRMLARLRLTQKKEDPPRQRTGERAGAGSARRVAGAFGGRGHA